MSDQNSNQASAIRSDGAALTPPAPALPPPASSLPPAKPLPKRDSADSIFAVLTFACAFLLIYLGAFGGMGLGFTIAVFASYAMLFAFAGARKLKIRPLAVAYAICALTLAGCYALYSNADLRVAWFGAIVLLTALFLLELCGARRFPHSSYWSMLDVLRAVSILPLAHIGDSLRFLFQKQENGRSGLSKILIGLGISLPVLAVLMPILASADAVFESLVSSLLASIGELLLSLFLGALLFFPLWSLLFGAAYQKQPKAPDIEKLRRVDSIILCVFLGAVALLYLVYLLAQTAYFFDAFRGIVPEGADSPSELARRGFFELCWIAVINAVLLFPVLALSKRNAPEKLPRALRILASVLCLQTLLLIATALRKMLLYIDIFGLTRLRVYTSAFMVFLALAWLILLLRLFIVKLPCLPMTALCAAAVLLTLTFGASDAAILRYNAELYLNGVSQNSGWELDFSEFYLSAEPGSVRELARLAKSDNERVREEACMALCPTYEEFYRLYLDWNTNDMKFYRQAEKAAEPSGSLRVWIWDTAGAAEALEETKDVFFEWLNRYWDNENLEYALPHRYGRGYAFFYDLEDANVID